MADTSPSLDKKTIRASPLLWLLGAICAIFLGALGTQMLSDVADAFQEPNLYAIEGRHVGPLREELRALDAQPDVRQPRIRSARADVDELDRMTTRAEESWKSWLATRATLGGSAREDQEVRERRDRLDALRAERDAAQLKLEAAQAEPDPRDKARAEIQGRIDDAERQAAAEHAAAERVWRWRVLSARLGIVVPVLGLAVVLWRRRARFSAAPLLWGYWAFSVWMVLWGIGPYLPRYGGYGPLLLGLGVTVWGSISLTRWLNGRAGLRRRRIVDLAIAKHRCPGCDRDYLLGRETSMDAGLGRKARTLHYDLDALRPRACPACGLALFAPCASCQSLELVHAERCSRCGSPRS